MTTGTDAGFGGQLPAVFTKFPPPGAAAQSDLIAPVGDGSNVSIPPQFNEPGPVKSVVAVETPKLGIGDAEPAFHGGGG